MKGKNFAENNADFITLDKDGKVVIQDDRLAKASEELVLDELEKVSGGHNFVNCACGRQPRMLMGLEIEQNRYTTFCPKRKVFILNKSFKYRYIPKSCKKN